MSNIEESTSSDVAVLSEGQTPGTLDDLIGAVARHILGFVEHRRGDLAELRRMDPHKADAAALWRVLAHHNIPTDAGEHEYRWALIVHGIALMTQSQQRRGALRYAHDRAIPVGRALFLGGDSSRVAALYSEQRLSRLLTARGPMLRTLLARLFRMCASNSVSFDWREMAWFILNEGHNEEEAEKARRRIASEYYRAERRTMTTDSNNQ